jgi:hypothetical protein
MATSRVVATRYSAEDYEAIKTLADAEGVSMSHWTRERCLDAKTREAELASTYVERIANLESKLLASESENKRLREELGLEVGAKQDDTVREALHMNMTRAEKRQLREYAYGLGMSMTNFVLARCVYNVPDLQPVLEYEQVNELYIELKREGTNLNQIAAAINTMAKIMRNNDYEIEEVAELAESVMHDMPEMQKHLFAAQDAVEAALVDAENKRHL